MLIVEHKNQTHPDWIEKVRSIKLERDQVHRGTGLFAVADPLKGPDAFDTVLVPGLTPEECQVLGGGCLAFKWLPDAVQKYENVIEEVTGKTFSCYPLPCGPSACPSAGCWCFSGTCRAAASVRHR
jgi:hypothetical protein